MVADRTRWASHVAAAAAYLLVAVALWWGVWSGHPTSTSTCGCGDTSLLTWYMAWPAYALRHGDSLLFSTRALHPAGINLLANTSFLAISVPLTPVTWLFGPTASLNVAATLAPVGGALSARALLLHWKVWHPAAFLAGLFYGFSPFVLENLTLQHVEFATLVVPPLLFLCFDELLVRQRHRAWSVGLAIALLGTLQFFVSAEVLAFCALSAAIGITVLFVATVLTDHRAVARRWRHAAAGLLVAAVGGGLLLAYPAWYAKAGPQPLPRRVWPDVQFFGSAWRTLFLPADPHDRGPNAVLDTYGYFGVHPLLLGYLGIGVAAVLLIGLAWFHDDRRLWFCAAMLVVLEGMSLGAAAWPWRLVDHLPLAGDVVPDRLAGVADLFAAVMLGVIVDRAHRSGLHWPWQRPGRPRAGTVVALALAGLALLPIAVQEWRPFTTRPVDTPRWFTTAGIRLPPGAVVLTYPFASSGLRASLSWQADTELRYSLVGGGAVTPDPPNHPTPAQRIDAQASEDLENLSDGFLALPVGAPAESNRLRRALHDWGVTAVVIPSEAGWPAPLRARAVPVAVATMTTALGVGPMWQDGAWVWSVSGRLGPALHVSPTVFVDCTTSSVAVHDPGAAATCVLRAPPTGSAP